MKNIISFVRGIVIAVVVIAWCHVNDTIQERYGSHSFYRSVERVHAQAGVTEAVNGKDKARASSAHEDSLTESLHERQEQLDRREKALKEEEKRIEALKREVTEKVESLKALERKISPPPEVQKAETDKKYKALAKMYEATPADKAAMIFEKMETKTAAEIMLRMNSKKAGSIWVHINRDIGLGIVREITSSQSVDAVSASKIAKEISGGEFIKPETSQRVSPEKLASTDKKITGAKMITKRDTSRSARKEITPINAKRNAGLKEEMSENVRSGGYKPFAIQIKAIRNLDAAKEYTKVLRDEGIDAYWSETDVKGKGTLYRILVSHFASRDEALKYMKNNNMDSNYPGSFIYKSDQKFSKKKKKRK